MCCRFDVVADQWVPYLCHFLLAVVLVFVASADAMYMVQKAIDGVLTLNWPLKVTILGQMAPPKSGHPLECYPTQAAFL